MKPIPKSAERRLAEKWVAAKRIAQSPKDEAIEAEVRLIRAITRRLTNTGHYGPG